MKNFKKFYGWYEFYISRIDDFVAEYMIGYNTDKLNKLGELSPEADKNRYVAVHVDFTESHIHFDVYDSFLESKEYIVDHMEIPIEEFIKWLNRYTKEN